MNIYVKEFFAETRDAAVNLAVDYYKVDAGELEVRELPETTKVDGLTDRSCFLISVAGMENVEAPRSERSGRGDRDRGRGDRDRGRGDRDRGRGDRGGRDRGRGRGDRGGDRGGDRRGRRPRSDKPEGVDHEALESIAHKAAMEVKIGGEAITLEPMNSKERWVVHNYLKDVEGVTSQSEGEGQEKVIRVSPEQA